MRKEVLKSLRVEKGWHILRSSIIKAQQMKIPLKRVGTRKRSPPKTLLRDVKDPFYNVAKRKAVPS